MSRASRLVAVIGALGVLAFVSDASAQPITSEPTWHFLEEEATGYLDEAGFKEPLLTSRNEIRAYVYMRLMQILRDGPGNAAEAAARDALVLEIRALREGAAWNAWQTYRWYAHAGCQTQVDALDCFINDWLGGAPTLGAFTAVGYQEALGDLTTDPNAIDIRVSAIHAVQTLAALHGDAFDDDTVFSLGKIPQGESFDAFRALAAGLAVASANQVLGDAVAFAVGAIATKVAGKALTFSRADAVTAVAAAVLVGWTFHQRHEFVAIGQALEERYLSIDSEPVDEYALATTTAGQVELFEVVMAKMMAGTSLVRSTECRFHDSYSGLPGEACDVYSIQHFQGARPDPDPDDAWVRYDTDPNGFGHAPPPAAGNAQFFLVPRGTPFDGVAGGPVIEEVMPWRARGLTNFGTLGPSSQRFAFGPNSDVYFLAENNALVSTYPPAPGTDPDARWPSEWKYTHTILYTNWNHEWWMASRVGDTFLHRKKATMIEGSVGVGEYSGGGRCFAHPPAVMGSGASATLLGAWTPQGALCVVGSGTDLGQLSPGDRILLGGEIRTVRRTVQCSEFNFLSLFFGIFGECRQSDPYLDDQSQKALLVDTPFSDEAHEASFDRFGNWLFPYSLVKLHEREAGGSCPDFSSRADIERMHSEGPPADVDCYYSPALQYAREKLVFPSEPATGNVEIEEYWTAVVGARMRAVDDEYAANEDSAMEVGADRGVLQNDFLPSPGNLDGRQPWADGASVTLEVLTPAADIIGSFELADDGSFVYEPDPAFNDWDSRDWEQRITYESCNSAAPQQCDRATLRFIIGNEPAEALNIEVAVSGPEANGDFKLWIDYEYADLEGDPESLADTEICIYEKVDGQPQPKGIPCISGAGARPLQYTLSSDQYLSSLNLLGITPHAQRGKERVPGEGFPGITAFHGLTDETALEIDAMWLDCLPGSHQLAPGLREVVGLGTWIECTATVDPYVPGEVFIESLLAESNHQYSFPNDYRWRRYHGSYEDTFDRQLCTLQPDPGAPGLGVCRFRWHSRSSDFDGDFPFGCTPWSLCVDEIETDFRAQLFDPDGNRTYRTVGQSKIPNAAEDTVTRGLSGVAGAPGADPVAFDVKHTGEQVGVPIQIPDGLDWSNVDVVEQPSIGAIQDRPDPGAPIAYSTEASLGQCCEEDPFTYRFCVGYFEWVLCGPAAVATARIVDGEPPVITEVTQTPEANAAGWQNEPVSLDYTCEDAHSEVVYCGLDRLVSSEGGDQTIAGLAVDAFGNQSSSDLILSIDMSSPRLEVVGSPLPRAFDWYKDDVSLTFVCHEDISSVSHCPAAMTVSGEGVTEIVDLHALDAAGNENIGIFEKTGATETSYRWIPPDESLTIRIDRTPPELSFTAEEEADGSYTVHFHRSDSLSGLIAPEFHYNTELSKNVVGVGSNPLVTARATDRAFNVTSKAMNLWDIPGYADAQAPTILGNVVGQLDPWMRRPVTLRWVCEDAGSSGLASCAGQPVSGSHAVVEETLSSEGANQTVSRAAVDGAGNSSAPLVSPVIQIDLSPPTIQETYTVLEGTGQTRVDYTCADQANLSGVRTCPASVMLSAGVNSIRSVAWDHAGNQTSVLSSYANGADTVPPVASVAFVPPPNASGWNKSATEVVRSCADSGSGAYPASIGPYFAQETAGTNGSHVCNDRAGNESAPVSYLVRIDMTPPRIQPLVTANGDGTFDIRYDCADDLSPAGFGSGISSCPADQSGVSSATLASGFEAAAIDVAGNVTSVFVDDDDTDSTPPEVSFVFIQEAGSGALAYNSETGWQYDATPYDTTDNGYYLAVRCEDASGLASCSDDDGVVSVSPDGTRVDGRVYLGDGQDLRIPLTAIDKAGFTTTVATGPPVSAEVNIDRSPPDIEVSIEPTGNLKDARVTIACEDALSGVSLTPYVDPPGFQPAWGQAPGVNDVTFDGDVFLACHDVAGNYSLFFVDIDHHFDIISPTITALVHTPPSQGIWHTTDVSVSFDCRDVDFRNGDPASKLVVSGVRDCPPDTLVTDEGLGVVVEERATDNFGNVSLAASICEVTGSSPNCVGNYGRITLNIDKTPPVVTTVVTPQGGGAYDVQFSCVDAVSGVAECPAGRTVSFEELLTGFDQQAADRAGNLTRVTVGGGSGDTDGDGTADGADNCPLGFNTYQADEDADGVGDLCEPDADGDGLIDDLDNCPFVANSDQLDGDGDAIGDVCDPDRDNDGIEDVGDNCPLTANASQLDSDADGLGNACDPLDDFDGDGVEDAVDNCPTLPNGPIAGPNDQTDSDLDGVGNACDGDFNQDGVVDAEDANVLLVCLGTVVGSTAGPSDDPSCAESDMSGDGLVGDRDYFMFLRVYPRVSVRPRCGLGLELALLMPLLLELRRRRHRKR